MSADEDSGLNRYIRQIDLFGKEGQDRIGTAIVAILGLGGLGSHVVQQLAYLGVQNFILADHDEVHQSNLNRLIGASNTCVGEKKTEIALQMIRSIQPKAQVRDFQVEFPAKVLSTALESASLIIGCFDNDNSRLQAIDFASRRQIPYVDAATDVISDGRDLIYGGRVVVSGTSRGCLSCLGKLNQNEIRLAQLNEEQLDAEARIYGVPVDKLLGTGPSVVTLNGVVASIASTEVMVILTGLRPAEKVQSYYASWGRITRSKDNPNAACFYCDNWMHSRD